MSVYYQPLHVSQDTFNWCMREWRRVETLNLESITSGDAFYCPAYGENTHLMHLDGNMKLYRYRNASRYGIGRLVFIIINQSHPS